MTKEQRKLLDQDLASIIQDLANITILLNACYGNKDPRVGRAEESQAALQRLLWALEREDQCPRPANEAGSGQVQKDRTNETVV